MIPLGDALRPGHRLALAPRFELAADWPRRLRLGAGVAWRGDRLEARGPWRAAEERELRILVDEAPAGASAAAPSGASARDGAPPLWLFRAPEHLRARFWSVLPRVAEAPGGQAAEFAAFAAAVADFLAFKRLAPPRAAVFDLALAPPGLASTRVAGLAFDVDADAPWPEPAPAVAARSWGAINFGDEATSLVFLNLSAQQIADLLEGDPPNAAGAGDARAAGERLVEPLAPPTHGALAARFFRRFPDYPLASVAIGPGEGYVLPPGGALFDGRTLDKRAPDALLLIHDPRGGPRRGGG